MSLREPVGNSQALLRVRHRFIATVLTLAFSVGLSCSRGTAEGPAGQRWGEGRLKGMKSCTLAADGAWGGRIQCGSVSLSSSTTAALVRRRDPSLLPPMYQQDAPDAEPENWEGDAALNDEVPREDDEVPREDDEVPREDDEVPREEVPGEVTFDDAVAREDDAEERDLDPLAGPPLSFELKGRQSNWRCSDRLGRFWTARCYTDELSVSAGVQNVTTLDNPPPPPIVYLQLVNGQQVVEAMPIRSSRPFVVAFQAKAADGAPPGADPNREILAYLVYDDQADQVHFSATATPREVEALVIAATAARRFPFHEELRWY